MPKHSQLVAVDYGRIHLRTMDEQAAGEQGNKPTIVLLSGPNKYFHADSAWFVTVQRQLAKHYKVRAIDRPSNGWTERTAKKLVAEREEIQTLTKGKSMDWEYYDAISQQRLLIDRQQTRSLEIAHYHDDLNAVANLELIEQIPVSVIDSDFEIEQIKDSPDKTAAVTQWMEEGTVWAKQVAKKSKGQYIEVNNAHHLVPLQHPDVIVNAVNWLAGKL